ncbi:MAG TPA: hypothetical protein VFI95_05175 [Terriglobales bacterium]|nr:hypothetical protein [Terriglobales bacterium]
MPMMNTVAGAVSKRLPKVVSPKGHAIIDYITAGSFLLAGMLFWKRNKRAALGALVCAGADLTLSLLTDYPGGVASVISFPTHCKIDLGLAAMTAEMPRFMKFEDDAEKKFFLMQGAGIITVTNLTDTNRPLYRLQERIEHARERRAA